MMKLLERLRTPRTPAPEPLPLLPEGKVIFPLILSYQGKVQEVLMAKGEITTQRRGTTLVSLPYQRFNFIVDDGIDVDQIIYETPLGCFEQYLFVAADPGAEVTLTIDPNGRQAIRPCTNHPRP